MKLRLFFDCTEIIGWKGHYTGIQRVVAGLYEGLQSHNECHVTAFYISSGVAYSVQTDEVLCLQEKDIVLTAGSNWDRQDNLVFFESVKSVGAYYINLFYDLTPILIPHSFGPGLGESYKKWLDRTLAECSLGIAISNNTICDLNNYVTKNRAQRQPGYFTIRLADKIEPIPNQANLPSGLVENQFILCVGSVEFRKNHITLLNAYRTLLSQGYTPPKLVIVGHEGWMNLGIRHQIDNDPLLTGNVVMLSSTTDEELSALYSSCMFTVYASIYEGWGLPIAESLCYGKPCIAADNSSLVEISPDYVVTAKTMDPYDWATKIELLSSDNSYREALSSKIVENYRQTSWKDTAAELVAKLKINLS